MVRLFKLVRTTAFLVVLCVSLATTAVSLGVWAVSLTAQVTTMTASAAAAAIAHRKAIAAAVLAPRPRRGSAGAGGLAGRGHRRSHCV
jgi:membrane protein implicated in regulation of membrane protease activity